MQGQKTLSLSYHMHLFVPYLQQVGGNVLMFHVDVNSLRFVFKND